MEKLTKALMTDETGQAIVGKLTALSGQMHELAMATRGSAILFESESNISVLGDGGYLAVYVGTTNPLVISGWTGDNSLVTGNLYYLMKSGTAVASRDLGEYGGAVTDTTLSISGAAADAKAVGDAVNGLNERLDDTKADLNGEESARINSDNDLQNAITAEKLRAESEEERIEALFTQPVEEAVSNWLDDHPEATTTVQDGAITESKLSNSLIQKNETLYSGRVVEKNQYSGSVVNFTDRYGNSPLKSLVVNMPYDSEGYDSADIIVSGKNMFYEGENDFSTTRNGMTIAYIANEQKFTISGTNTKTDAAWLLVDSNILRNHLDLKKGVNYTLKATQLSGVYYQITYYTTSETTKVLAFLNPTTEKVVFPTPNDFDRVRSFQIGIYASTTTIPTSDIRFTIEQGDLSQTFIPYVNRTKVTIDFNRTIYGGTLNAVSGELISTYASDGTELQTPEIYNLGSYDISTVKGDNYIWSDKGDVAVTVGLVISKNTDWKNPKLYGAVGDGVHDDTEAFQALDGETIYIPEGTYLISSVIYGAGTKIRGAGMNKTIIKQMSNCDEDMITYVNANGSGLSDVTLLGRGYDSGEINHTYLFQALLKIRNETNSFNNYSVYEHLSIRNAPMNGMVVSGSYNQYFGEDFNDERYPDAKSNFVHHFNDIRIEKCKRFCLIDRSSDNRFSNFYLSDGDVGCFLMNGSNCNMYVNFKLDQPYTQGGNGSEDGYEDGACLLIRFGNHNNLTNFDVQSAYYVGVKVYNTTGLYYTGLINNCGRHSPDGGTGLKIKNSNHCTFNVDYFDAGYSQRYNTKIESDCYNISIYERKTNNALDINNSKSSCFIYDISKMATVYNTTFGIANNLNNLFVNPLCQSTEGYRIVNATIDSTGKVVGDYSFKVVGDTSSIKEIRQDFNELTPDDIYLYAVEVVIETVGTTGSIYALSESNNAETSLFSDHKYADKTQVGRQLCFNIAKVSESGRINNRFYFNKTDAVGYVGNFIFAKLSDVVIDSKLNARGYKELYQDMLVNIGSQYTEASYTVGSEDIMGMLKHLMNS